MHELADAASVHGMVSLQPVGGRLHAEQATIGRQPGHIPRALQPGELVDLPAEVRLRRRVLQLLVGVIKSVPLLHGVVVGRGRHVNRRREPGMRGQVRDEASVVIDLPTTWSELR